VSEDRLGRIETKLDDLAKAVVDLARMEERMITLFNRMDTYDQAQFKLTERVGELEQTLTKKNTLLSVGERMVWLIVGLVAASIFTGITPSGIL